MTRRLMIASGIFHPESGGPATYLHELLPALQSRGWDVRAVTYGTAVHEDYGYPVRRIPRQFLPVRLLRYGLATRDLLRWADVVYMHTIDLPLWPDHRAPRVLKVVGDRAWERAVERGWVAPDTDIDTFQTTDYSGRVNAIKRSRSRQVQAMHRVIVPSEYLKTLVVGWGVEPAQVQVIYNALPPAIDIPDDRAALRAELGLSSAPLIVTAARLKPWKGIDHLITALHTVPDVCLVVAGDGDDLARLQQLAQALGDRVQFVGRLSRAVLYRYMRAADYFALYSGYEGLPHTLLESLRLGTPVIASAKGGNQEVVTADNGFLVPYVDIAALTETIQQAFSGDTAQTLRATTADGLERFTFAHMVEQTAEALATVADRGSNTGTP